MNKEKITKDFAMLYIGQDPKRLAEEYFGKKRRDMMLLVMIAILKQAII